MKYHLEMPPAHLVELNELLRVTPADFEQAIKTESEQDDTPVRRILRARVFLELFNRYQVVEGRYIGDAIIGDTKFDYSVPVISVISMVPFITL